MIASTPASLVTVEENHPVRKPRIQVTFVAAYPAARFASAVGRPITHTWSSRWGTCRFCSTGGSNCCIRDPCTYHRRLGDTRDLQLHRRTPSDGTSTTGEPKFPECHRLPRVPKIGHSGKPIFPECCTRGRIALGEERLSRVPQNTWLSGKSNTR